VVVRGRAYAEAELAYGRKPLALVAARSLMPTVRVDHPLVRRVLAATVVELPVRQGEALGEIRVYQRGRLVGVTQLVAGRSATRPGIAGRTGWYAGRTLHHMWGWVS